MSKNFLFNLKNITANRLRIVLAAVLVFLPFAIWLVLIDRYGVNLPIYDQWDTPREQIVAYFRNEFNLDIIFKQHNESRAVIPIIIFMTFPILTGEWNTRWEMFLGLAFAGLMSLLVMLLLQRTNPKHLFQNLLLLLFYNYLLLSFRAYFLWLNGTTLHRLLPEFCLLFNALVFTLSLSPLTKTILLVSGAVIAQYSFASGILVWLLSLPLLLVLALNSHSKHQRNQSIFIYVISFILSSLLYFWDYQTPETSTSLLAFFEFSVLEILQYCFAFLGNLLTNNDAFTVWVGWGITVIFLSLIFWRRRSLISPNTLPWFVIGTYPILLAILSMITRLPMGKENALAMRYLTHLVYLPLAITALAFILANTLKKPVFNALAMFLVGLMSWLYFKCNFDQSVFGNFPEFRHDISSVKACVQLIEFYRDENCLRKIAASPNKIYELDQLGLLKPGTAKSLNINRLPGNWGTIEILERTPEGIHLEGWAVLKKRPADALLILQEIPNQPPQVLDIWATGRENNLIKFPNAWQQGGWEGTIETVRFPDDTNTDLCTLHAYAFDTEKNQLFPLKRGQRTIPCN